MDSFTPFRWRRPGIGSLTRESNQSARIRGFSRVISCLVFALVMPLVAQAQDALKPGREAGDRADNATAFYEPVLKPYETIVQTSDGCKHISSRYIEIGGYVLTPYDAMRYYTWYGACVNGFSLGPGFYFRKSEATGQNITRVWSLYGRLVGDVVEVLDSRHGENGFAWDGNYYALRNDGEHIAHNAPGVHHVYSVSSLFCKDSRGNRVDYCIKEYHNGETHHACKTMDDCKRKMTQFPLYAEYNEFVSMHQADVEAAMRSMDPRHVPLIQAKLNELPAIEQKLYDSTAEYRAQRDAERQRSDEKWNQYVAQREQQRAEERKQAWGKILNGVLSVADAAANVQVQAAAQQQDTKQMAAQQKAAVASKHQAPGQDPGGCSTNVSTFSAMQTDCYKYFEQSTGHWRIYNSDAEAGTECVDYQSPYIYNKCGFDLEVSFCIVNPAPFEQASLMDGAAAFDCAKEQGGMFTLPANTRHAQPMKGGGLQFVACKKPASPTQVKMFDAYNGKRMVGYCS